MFLDNVKYLIGIRICKQWHSRGRQPWSSSVNLYIAEL
jgi:hypothetical protein